MKSILFIALILFQYYIVGNPVDLQVIEGVARPHSKSTQGELILDVSDRAILHWKDFSIGRGEKVQFILPGSESAVLNRVVGSHKSLIEGCLESNGHVLLINPHGILIGPKGQIDTASLIATSLDLDNRQFLEGNEWTFAGNGAGGIVNCGTIRSPYGGVSLFGRFIHNEGKIEGSTSLVSGQEVLLKLEGNKQTLIRTNESPQTIQVALINGKSPYEYAIKNSGEIDALSLSNENGRVTLRSTEDVRVTGAIYGNSELQGKVVQVDGAIEAPSGEVKLMSSKFTDITEKGRLNLRGKGNSKGGNALIYSDESLLFAGTADIRGGPLGGDGGTLDLSGLQSLEHTGEILRSSIDGTPGTLTFDPDAKLTISQSPSYHQQFDGMTHKPLKQMVNINIDTLLNEIEKGPVTVLTNYNGYDHELGGIELSADVFHSYDSPYPLTLRSSGPSGIEVLGTLMNKGNGSIKLESTRGNITHRGKLETAGDLSMDSAARITLEGTPKQKATALVRDRGNLELKSATEIEMTQAKLITQDGDLFIGAGGPISLKKGTELMNFGRGAISFTGSAGRPIESLHLDRANILTSIRSGPITVEPIARDIQINGATIQGGTGGIRIQYVGGDLKITGTSSPAKISSESNLDIHTKGDIHIDADQTQASLSSKRTIHIQADRNYILSANEGNASTSSLESIVIGAEHMVLSGQQGKKATIEGEGISLNANRSLSLFSNSEINGNSRPLIVNAGEELSLSNPQAESPPLMIAGHVNLHSNAAIMLENDAKIVSTHGELTLKGKKEVHLSHLAEVSALGGNLIVSAPEGTIQMFQNSALYGKTGEVRLTAGKSIMLDHFSKITSEGAKGVTILVDTKRTAPRGGLMMGPNTAISTNAEAPLRIFSSARHLNSIEGTLNGFKYVSTPLYFSTQEEQWGVSSLAAESMGPFTIFHNDNGLILGNYTHKTFKQALINFIGPYTAELFRNLLPYNEYTLKTIHFTNKYSSKPGDFRPDELNSFEVIKKTGYWIRTRTFSGQNFSPLHAQ